MLSIPQRDRERRKQQLESVKEHGHPGGGVDVRIAGRIPGDEYSASKQLVLSKSKDSGSSHLSNG